MSRNPPSKNIPRMNLVYFITEEFLHVYRNVRSTLNDGEYVVLNNEGILTRTDKPIEYGLYGVYYLKVQEGDLEFYEQLYKSITTIPHIPPDIVGEFLSIISTLEKTHGVAFHFRVYSVGLETPLTIKSPTVLPVLLNGPLVLPEGKEKHIHTVLEMLKNRLNNPCWCELIGGGATNTFCLDVIKAFTVYACRGDYKKLEGYYFDLKDFEKPNYNVNLLEGCFGREGIYGFIKPSLLEKL